MGTGEWVVVVLVVLVVGFVLGRRTNADPVAEARARSEATRRTAAHVDAVEGAARSRVLAELRAGRKIEAIKLFREASGLDLKASKEAVEELARREGL